MEVSFPLTLSMSKDYFYLQQQLVQLAILLLRETNLTENPINPNSSKKEVMMKLLYGIGIL